MPRHSTSLIGPRRRRLARLAVVSALFAFGLRPAAAGPLWSSGSWWTEGLRAFYARLSAASDQELVEELESAPRTIRFEIAKEMARRNKAVFVALWRPLLAGEDRLDRALAGLVLARAGEDEGLAVALGELASSTAELRDRSALRDQRRVLPEDYGVRTQEARHLQYTALLVLGLVGDSRALDALIEATRDPATAYQAALSLAEIGDRRAIPALREMARDQPSQRLWAGWALAAMGEPDGSELLLDVAGSDLGWDQRRHAIAALGELRIRSAVDALAKLLHDGNVHLRVAAARALGGIGDAAALPALLTALADTERTTVNEDVSVGEVAREAIRRLESADVALPPQ